MDLLDDEVGPGNAWVGIWKCREPYLQFGWIVVEQERRFEEVGE